jgi:mannose-6-phosphate isomerase-like protein (cupin superfamily)
MSTYVSSEPRAWNFDKLGHRGKLFTPSDALESTSHLIVEIDGQLPSWLRQNECDFVYYVLKGRGQFFIEDREEACARGDLIRVPKGSKFTYKGHRLRMLLTSTPPWWETQEQVLEDSSTHLIDEKEAHKASR